MLMHYVPPDTIRRFGTPLIGPNHWPAGRAGFSEAVVAYDTALHGVCLRVVRLDALALDLPPGALAPYFRRPNTFLRPLHIRRSRQMRRTSVRLRATHRLRLHHNPGTGQCRRPGSGGRAAAT